MEQYIVKRTGNNHELIDENGLICYEFQKQLAVVETWNIMKNRECIYKVRYKQAVIVPGFLAKAVQQGIDIRAVESMSYGFKVKNGDYQAPIQSGGSYEIRYKDEIIGKLSALSLDFEHRYDIIVEDIVHRDEVIAICCGIILCQKVQ